MVIFSSNLFRSSNIHGYVLESGPFKHVNLLLILDVHFLILYLLTSAPLVKPLLSPSVDQVCS